MKCILLMAFAVTGQIAVVTKPLLRADVVLTTSTANGAALDFDGSGNETSGDLGIAFKAFFLTGSAIPSAAEFASITSISLMFQGAAGKTLSAGGTGIAANGIGLTHSGETGTGDIESFSDGVDEVMTLIVSSTSSVPGHEVLFLGVAMNSWRNAFPLSEVTLTGATFNGGQNVLTGGSGVSPDIVFDSPVSTFSLESTGPDPIRLASIRLGVSTIPEPATTALLCAMVALFMPGRQKQTIRPAQRIDSQDVFLGSG